ncbi:hypothetical protein JCM8547_009374 [Rhodosporidiobolus lusitaniae]
MASIDRTLEFKEAVQHKERNYPPTKRAEFGARRAGPDAVDDPWTRQAEQVAANLNQFSLFLTSIRRAYLDLNSSTHHAHHRQDQQRNLDPSKGLAAWEGVRWLSDRERDEIDFGVKVALRKSVDRVRELEALEKLRLSKEKQEASKPSSRLFGSSSSSSSSSISGTSELLASHRSFVTLYLNALLASVSQRQRDQQEARVWRQLEKTQSLGGMGGGGALGMDELGKQMAGRAKAEFAAREKGKGKEQQDGQVGQVPSMYRPAPLPGAGEDEEDEDDNPLGSHLTAEQVQQFEAEESALLKATQSDLEALKTAESSLLEIASLQSQLAMHLTQQAELTDQLWEDAVTVTGKVGEGNQQLKKAKERGRESRVWLLIFLFGSAFTLLFLDYYS